MITSKENFDAMIKMNKDLIAKQLKAKDKRLEKEARNFMANRRKQMKRYGKILKPRMDYDKKWDIFYIAWGSKKVYSTLELSNDFRMDITKNGEIIGIEIENFLTKLHKNKL